MKVGRGPPPFAVERREPARRRDPEPVRDDGEREHAVAGQRRAVGGEGAHARRGRIEAQQPGVAVGTVLARMLGADPERAVVHRERRHRRRVEPRVGDVAASRRSKAARAAARRARPAPRRRGRRGRTRARRPSPPTRSPPGSAPARRCGRARRARAAAGRAAGAPAAYRASPATVVRLVRRRGARHRDAGGDAQHVRLPHAAPRSPPGRPPAASARRRADRTSGHRAATGSSAPPRRRRRARP